MITSSRSLCCNENIEYYVLRKSTVKKKPPMYRVMLHNDSSNRSAAVFDVARNPLLVFYSVTVLTQS